MCLRVFHRFTCFVVILLFAVVYGISMYRYSPSHDCTVAHSHKLDHLLPFESMQSVAYLLWPKPPLQRPLHHQNCNYYCCVDCCCYAIASAMSKLYLISLDSLFATLVPLLHIRNSDASIAKHQNNTLTIRWARLYFKIDLMTNEKTLAKIYFD